MQRRMTQENTENGQWSGDGAMDSTTLDQDADAANRAWPGIGQELRLTRESAGHSLEAVAETLRIQAQHLHALEEGLHDDLPGAAYAIGFLRSYADYLGLDADKAVTRFKEEAEIRARPTPLVFPQPIGAAQRPSGRLALLSVLAAGLAYGGWLLYDNLDRGLLEEIPPPPERLSSLLDDRQGTVDQPATRAGTTTGDSRDTAEGGQLATPATEPGAEAGTDGSSAAPTVSETADEDGAVAADAGVTSETATTEPAQDADVDSNDGSVRAETAVDRQGTPSSPTESETPLVAEAVTVEAGDEELSASVEDKPVSETATAVDDVPAPVAAGNAGSDAPARPTAAFAYVEPTRVEVASREDMARENASATDTDQSNIEGERVAAADASGVAGSVETSALASDRASEGPSSDGSETVVARTEATGPTDADRSTPAPIVTDPAASAGDDAGADPATPQTTTPSPTQAVAPPPAPQTSTGGATTAREAISGYRPQVYGAANGDARVVLRARADSWVQIQGAGNELLLTRILRAGDTYRTPNREDLLLMTGNAGAIELILDGESLGTLGPEGEVRRNIPLKVDTIKLQIYGEQRDSP